MKSNQLVLAIICAAVLIFGGAIIYKTHHKGATPAPAHVVAKGPAPAPAPAAPTRAGTTVKSTSESTEALKSGVLKPIFYLQEKMAMLRQGLTAAFNTRSIALADLDKLDFGTAPSTDPYNVFNPNGKIGYVPVNGVWIDQSLIDKITTKKGSPLVYNLRRTVDKEGTSEILYAVLPNIAPADCGIGAGNQIYTSNAPLAIENDNHTIVDDPPGMPIIDNGCVKTPAGLVWFYKLRLRFKHTGQENWGSR